MRIAVSICLTVAILAVGLLGVYYFEETPALQPTKRVEAYHRWCSDQGGTTKFDRHKRPYACNIPSTRKSQ